MIEYEDPDFRASKFPPNPVEVTYWIDLSRDPYGNIIRSYNPNEKRWLPLNHDYNKDLYDHIQLLVDTLGFVWNHPAEDTIKLPDFSKNQYFKEGLTLTDILRYGDNAVHDEVVRLDKRIDDEIERATTEEARLDTKIDTETNRATTKEDSLQASITALQGTLSSLLSSISTLSGRISALETQYSNLLARAAVLEDEIGLNEEII